MMRRSRFSVAHLGSAWVVCDREVGVLPHPFKRRPYARRRARKLASRAWHHQPQRSGL
jgi:hypothetical protein